VICSEVLRITDSVQTFNRLKTSIIIITSLHMEQEPMLSPGRRHRRYHRTERAIADAKLGGFIANGTRREALLERIYPGGSLTRRSLYSFASILSALAGVTLERDMTRRKSLLMKWLDMHYDLLQPYVTFVELVPL
jgi:hypothetical protein